MFKNLHSVFLRAYAHGEFLYKKTVMSLTLYMAAAFTFVAAVQPAAHGDERTLVRLGTYGMYFTTSEEGFDFLPLYGPGEVFVSDVAAGLFVRDAFGRVVPGMAGSYSQSADGLVWTFELIESYWSDGRRVVADDFVLGFRLAVPPNSNTTVYNPLEVIRHASDVIAGRVPPAQLGVAALSDSVLTITLARPYPNLPRLLTILEALPAPHHVPRDSGDSAGFRALFNGAYQIVESSEHGIYMLSRNPGYRGEFSGCADNVMYNDLIYFQNEDLNAEEILRTFRQGDLHLIENIGADLGEFLGLPLSDAFERSDRSLIEVLQFNVARPGLSDRRVRQALAMSVDPSLSARYDNVAISTFGDPNLYGPGNAIGRPSWMVPALQARRAAAVRLLAASGFSRANPLVLRVSTPRFSGALRNREHYMRAVALDWQSTFGDAVQISTASVDPMIFEADRREGHYDVIIHVSWLTDDDVDARLDTLARFARETRMGEHVSRTIRQAQAARDPRERARLAASAESVLLDEAVTVPLSFPRTQRFTFAGEGVQGLDLERVHYPSSRHLCPAASP